LEIFLFICFFVRWLVYRGNRTQGTAMKNVKHMFLCEILERPLCCALRHAGREHTRNEDGADQHHVQRGPVDGQVSNGERLLSHRPRGPAHLTVRISPEN